MSYHFYMRKTLCLSINLTSTPTLPFCYQLSTQEYHVYKNKKRKPIAQQTSWNINIILKRINYMIENTCHLSLGVETLQSQFDKCVEIFLFVFVMNYFHIYVKL